LITNPTRFSATGSTLIDNIFTNCLEENCQAGVLINDISDHLPVCYHVLNILPWLCIEWWYNSWW